MVAYRRGPYRKRSKDELAAKEERRRAAVIGTPLTAREVARFRAMVDVNGPVPSHCPELGPCHIWTGSKMDGGYGKFVARGRVTGAWEGMLAHRFAVWIEDGAPPKRQTLHRCDNPPCVNRAHLRDGTQRDNMREASAKGRLFVPGLAANRRKRAAID